MCDQEELEIRRLQQELSRRQQVSRKPRLIAESISQLLSRRGYGQVETIKERQEVWNRVAGQRMAADTRVGQLRRGVLEIMVRNSVLVQELTLRKQNLLREMRAALGEAKIRDLRFRVDLIDR